MTNMTIAVNYATNYVPFIKSIKMERHYNLLVKALSKPTGSSKDILGLIHFAKKGISYNTFSQLTKVCPFTFNDWCTFLQISRRTMERNRFSKKQLEPAHTERVFEVLLVYNKGVELWGSKLKFDKWLCEDNIALGGVKPQSLLDSSFGIGLLNDQLGRIEYGVLA